MIVPELVGVMVRAQLEVVALTEARVHGDPVKAPVGAAVPVLVRATVPAGADDVPAAPVSFTKAVQVTSCPVETEVGEHVTTVEVGRRVTVTVLPAVGPLPAWAVSAAAAVYVPLAITLPALVGVKVTLQLAVVALTVARVQGDPTKEPVEVPPFVNATVPVGVLAVPAAEVSFTNPVHVIAWETKTVAGVHETAVDVVRRFTVTVFPAVGPLPLWTVSDEV
jgi:hypothetical protein